MFSKKPSKDTSNEKFEIPTINKKNNVDPTPCQSLQSYQNFTAELTLFQSVSDLMKAAKKNPTASNIEALQKGPPRPTS